MKNIIKYILQKLLGYQRYLYLFARYKIKTLKKDRKEKDFFKFIEMVDQDGILLDIGANLGIMTTHLSRSFPEQKIVAIEPVPSNVSVLNKIIQQYKLNNVRVDNFALGNEDSTITMVLPTSGKVKMQGLSHVIHPEITEWNNGEQFEVKSKKLDHMNLNTVSAIKIDVENYEYSVLRGAEKLLKKDRPLIYMELWDNKNRKDCFEFLKNIGYQAYVVVNNNLCLFDPLQHDKQNFIFQ